MFATRVTDFWLPENLHAVTSGQGDVLYIFYLELEEQARLLAQEDSNNTRKLTQEDAEVFAEFQSKNSADELEEAEVSLDDWLIYGSFSGDSLAAVASMYTWPQDKKDSKLADIGVIARPEFRGQGFAKQAVRAISREALKLGYEPQYQCGAENTNSVNLARACGFTLFAQQQILEPKD